MNLILCGMMGSGKTTVGLKLAEISGLSHCDTDNLIVEKYGEISTIFKRYGEACFRDMETKTVAELSDQDGLIISTGGGLVLREENVRLLKKKGRICYLRASVNTLEQRLKGDETRPLLKDKDALHTLMAKRAPTYESVADFIVDVDGKTPEKVAKEILSVVQKIRK